MSKISELSDGGSLLPTDFLIAVRSGGNVKVQADQTEFDRIRLGDNEKIELGNSQDLELYHSSTQSIINQAGVGDLLIQKGGVTKLTVNSTGIDVVGTATVDGLTSSGDVTLSGASSPTIRITDTTNTCILDLRANDSDTLIRTTSNHPMILNTNQKDRIQIAANGDISFFEDTGTTAKLHWSASAESLDITGAGGLDVNTATGSVNIQAGNAAADISLGIGSPSTANKVVVTAGGSVGIGIAPLSFTDLIVNTATNRNMSIFDNAAGATICGLTDAGASSALRLAGSPLLFTGAGGSGGEHMRIASGGTLLLGTDTVAYAGTLLNIGKTSDSQNGIQIQTATDGNGYILFGDGAGGDAYRGQVQYEHAYDRLTLRAAGLDRASFSDTESVFNQTAQNTDFRVESYSNQYMLLVDAGNDCVNINTAGAKQSVASLNSRVNGAAIEFGHTNNSAGYFGTLGSQGNNGHPYLGFSTSAEYNANTYKTYGAKGNIITGDLSGNLQFSQVTTASATGQTPVERFRLDASGNLLVGNTVANPASGFTAQKGFGYEASTGKTEIATTADAPVMHIGKNHANDGDILVFRKQSTAIGSIGTSTGGLYIADAGVGFRFDSGGTDDIIPCNATGAAADASINLGSSGARFQDAYLSGGIYLGGTAAANQLSDYETGSWTPVLRGTGTAGTPSVGTVYGSYVKVGKLVTLTFHISNMTLSGAVGAIQITGVPFTAKTASNNYGTAAFSMTSNINFDGDKNQNWYMGSSYILGLESQNGGGWADLAVTNASAIYMNQTITFEVA